MSYIGRGLDAISNVEKLDNITFDGSATYALEKSSVAYTPSGANNILISIDGVVQQGNFSVSTTNIVFDWSPTSSNTCDWILHIGVGVLNVPADGSIVAAKMAANSVDSDSYVDGSIDTAHIDALQVTGAKLNTDVISAQTELASAPADADEFMVSDGGVLKRIDYSLIKGNLIKVHTITASDDADVTFSSTYLTSTYKRYTLEAFDVQSAEDDVAFGLYFSIDDGIGYTPGTVTRINISNSSDQENDEIKSRNTSVTYLQLGGGYNFGTGTGEVGAFTFELVNFSDTAHYKLMYYNGAYFTALGTGAINLGAGVISTTSAINNIKFSFGSGNITAGTFVLYGIV